MKKPNINLFAGEVKTISVEEKTIFLKNDKAEMTIVCNDKTVFRSGTSKVTFSDIKKGDIAAVIYDVVDGKNVAKSITFQVIKRCCTDKVNALPARAEPEEQACDVKQNQQKGRDFPPFLRGIREVVISFRKPISL